MRHFLQRTFDSKNDKYGILLVPLIFLKFFIIATKIYLLTENCERTWYNILFISSQLP